MGNFTVQSIKTHVSPVDTFKTTTFVMQLRTPLNKKTATERALLPAVLERGSFHFPSRQHIQGALEELYGAHFTADVVKKGEHHVMTFRMEVANEKFLTDTTPLTGRAIQLLASVLLYPLVENDSFSEQAVEEEKRSHRQKIASVYDDKMRYANMRLTEEMCRDEPYSVPVLGYEKELDSINGQSLYKAYKKLLKEAAFDFYVVGDVEEKNIKAFMNEYMLLKDNNPLPYKLETEKVAEEARIVKEKQDVQQGKLHIGYRTNVVFGDPDYFPLQVFNSLFGGSPHSKLFINVREKANLAYYAASRVESHKGLIIVLAGIDSGKFEEASEIIDKQLSEMQKGSFTEEDIDQTKAVLKNQILETIDVPRGRIELEYHGAIIGRDISAEDWIKAIDKVTKEDMLRAGENIIKDTTYFLHGEGGDK
ncbi:EF-P 5-aminopentanol modification-associated protein YfmF [Alkalicoccus halolimnae]|uniref:Pitrilysin family protein n=1 Tax=Alkalicoccus halolimnae TaxID=1667239 RepID=A0AAJ8LS39_9BACI|nr:pitrilysin family protein [Alkalicoccus halolimnae]